MGNANLLAQTWLVNKHIFSDESKKEVNYVNKGGISMSIDERHTNEWSSSQGVINLVGMCNVITNKLSGHIILAYKQSVQGYMYVHVFFYMFMTLSSSLCYSLLKF